MSDWSDWDWTPATMCEFRPMHMLKRHLKRHNSAYDHTEGTLSIFAFVCVFFNLAKEYKPKLVSMRPQNATQLWVSDCVSRKPPKSSSVVKGILISQPPTCSGSVDLIFPRFPGGLGRMKAELLVTRLHYVSVSVRVYNSCCGDINVFTQ